MQYEIPARSWLVRKSLAFFLSWNILGQIWRRFSVVKWAKFFLGAEQLRTTFERLLATIWAVNWAKCSLWKYLPIDFEGFWHQIRVSIGQICLQGSFCGLQFSVLIAGWRVCEVMNWFWMNLVNFAKSGWIFRKGKSCISQTAFFQNSCVAGLRLCVRLGCRTKELAIQKLVSLSVFISGLNEVAGVSNEVECPFRHAERIGGLELRCIVWTNSCSETGGRVVFEGPTPFWQAAACARASLM